MKQKNIFQEKNLWHHVSHLAILTLLSLPENSKLKCINIVKRYIVLIHNNMSY
jgi:hypothetical protein